MAAPALLTAEGVGWRYRRGPELLRDISLTVPAGGLLRVRGGNGAGKSTLLRLLAGTLEPRRGVVRRSGPVAHLPQTTQDLPPIPAGRLLRLLTGDAGPDALPGQGGTRADRLSEGWQRRLLLEAVLRLPCSVLVLDEPAAGLDDGAVARLTTRLADRLAAGDAVVLAEHEALPLPGGEVLDLGGRSAAPGRVRVVLGGEGTFRGAVAEHGGLVLTVAEAQRDEVLLAALHEGWSVRAVGPAT